MTVTRLEPITACSCGRLVARDAGLLLTTCPHVDEPVADGFHRVLRALQVAAGHLMLPATACTCPRAAVVDLDPDPDCPGHALTADGCRVTARVRARAALAEVGIDVPCRSLRSERAVVYQALEHARAVFATHEARAAAIAAGGVEVVRSPDVAPHPQRRRRTA